MEPSARLAIVVLVVVAASVANAAGTDSLPHMNSVAHATDDTMLTVECDPTSRGKAECSIVEVTVIQPRTDPREREKAIADFDALTTGKKGEAEFAKVCADVRKDQSPASGRRKEYSDRMRAACAAKDPPALWRAVRAWQDDVEAKTCHFLVVPQRIEFSQVDANNWRSVETGLCATAVRTLSRKSGLWTYHTTRTVRPNSSPCAEPGKTTTTTYDPLIGEERELRCRYWR